MKPYFPPIPEPKWDPENLTDHHKKRLYESRGCIEKLLGKHAGTLTEKEYEEFSKRVLDRPLMAWQAFSESEPNKGDHEHREFVLSKDLAMSILNEFRSRFITCYHLHLPACVKHSTTRSSLGGLKAKALTWIRGQENTNRFRGRAKVYDL
jgi:hypothetical protein